MRAMNHEACMIPHMAMLLVTKSLELSASIYRVINTNQCRSFSSPPWIATGTPRAEEIVLLC